MHWEIAMSEITVFTKAGGPLTKRISLAPDGTVTPDGSVCVMARGSAERTRLTDIAALAGLIDRLRSDQAIALGRLRPGLPARVEVTTKNKINGVAQPHIIARTAADIVFAEEHSAFTLIDFDSKGISADAATRLAAAGGVWQALASIIPALPGVAHVTRRSTSAGLFRGDTGEPLPGSNNQHIYLAVRDGANVDRFVRTLHERCWLAGFGWMMVGAGGLLLERSIVDRMVGGAERLVFEGPPVLVPPVVQDADARRPVAVAGDTLDTFASCPPWTMLEKARLRELQAREAHRVAPDSAAARAKYIAEKGACLAARTGKTQAAAAEIIARQCNGVLLPDVMLPFDDPDLVGATVADVLADPERFIGETLADPLEGVAYGAGKSKIMRRADGSVGINSFAHGRTVYELRLDARAVRTAMDKASDADVVGTFVRLALVADLGDDETEDLRNHAAERSGVSKRTISKTLKAAQEQEAGRRAEEVRKRRLAERRDPRPEIVAPNPDDPWLPVMATLNDVLANSPDVIPPSRDIDGVVRFTRLRRIAAMHAFSQETANAEDREGDLPPPEQWLLTRANEMQLAELIERHIDFVEGDGRSVHLSMPFVRHYVQRHDDVLPTVTAIATQPIVLADGTVLARAEGLDRGRGIVFHIARELLDLVPRRESCTPEAVVDAMRFLTEDWLCDVATDYAGKCTLIAAGLTIIERSLLPDRPAFFVTAGRRGGGKTTTLIMLIAAITGVRPSAAAWSPNEEERRKALLSYFLDGVSYILWDNIPRGYQISCPHIEKSCTAAYYSDRRLGVSEAVATSASTIHFFTGNNISPRGDLASRSLQVRLDVDRADPENRSFRHPDPVGWTLDNRAKILQALYTVLLGNPILAQPRNAAARTRFKLWWRVAGSAVEHAAELAGKPVDFQTTFLDQEADEDDGAALVDALGILAQQWPMQFKASDVATLVNDRSNPRGTALRDFLFPDAPQNHIASPKSVGKLLAAHVDEPIKSDNGTLILRKWRPPDGGPKGALSFFVHVETE
jgi:hypothetical protein